MIIESIFLLLGNIMFQTSYVDNDKAFPQPLDAEREAELINLVKLGDMNARDELIRHNMRLVVHVAKKYNNYPDTDELISVGSIGLIKAVNTFAHGKGTQLATYACRCIENEILMTLRANKKYKKDRSLYEPLSYDKDGNEITLIDLIATDEDSVINSVENSIISEKLMAILKKVLTTREYDILVFRYGLNNCPSLTQIEVAAKFNISRSYVSRIEKKALHKVKTYMEEQKISFK